LAEKYYKISPYAYVANNPITTIDPDGRYLFGLFGSTSAERKEARAEKYAEKVGGTVVKGENGYVGVNVVKKGADGSNTIVGKTNFGDFATVKGNIKNWTRNNKEALLKTSENMQKVGDAMVLTGTGAAIIGAPVAGVGAAPGLALVGAGTTENLIGAGLGILVNAVAGDTNKALQQSVNAASDKLVDIAIDKAVDAIVPGPTPNVSGAFREALKANNEVAKVAAGGIKTGYNLTTPEE
jgi:hypothetical protein